MTSALVDQAEKALIMRTSKYYFASQGWVVLKPLYSTYDSGISKGSLKFFITCLDSRIRDFYSTSKIAARLRDEESQLRTWWHTRGVVIMTSHFLDLAPVDATDSELSLLTTNELAILGDLPRLIHEPVFPLEKREHLLLAGQVEFCHQVSDVFHANQNLAGALYWARLAHEGVKSFSPAHQKLHQLLVEASLHDEASIITKEALKHRPDNLFFLKASLSAAKKKMRITI